MVLVRPQAYPASATSVSIACQCHVCVALYCKIRNCYFEWHCSNTIGLQDLFQTPF